MKTPLFPLKMSAGKWGLSLLALCALPLSSALAQIGSGTTTTGSQATGQIILGAPGVGLTYATVTALPFSQTSNIGRYFRFTFTGIEVQCDADGVPGTYAYDGYMWDKKKKSNNGHGNNCDGVDSSNPGNSKAGLDSDPTVDDECKKNVSTSSSGVITNTSGAAAVYGNWTMWGIVNSIRAGDLTFSTAELNKLSPLMRLYLSTPVYFKEQIMNLTWAGSGNTKDPDGHFYILGSAIKEPPVPQGKLKFNQTVYQIGEKPPFQWSVVRE